jgi:hypothetical protein
MKVDLPLLDRVRVAAPCSASWQNMIPVADGNRIRFCGECSLNVYNISAMTRAEAETLLREHEGRLCIKLFKRSDGTVLTSDCPVGLEVISARPKRGSFRAYVAVSAMLCAVTVFAPAWGLSGKAAQTKRIVKTASPNGSSESRKPRKQANGTSKASSVNPSNSARARLAPGTMPIHTDEVMGAVLSADNYRAALPLRVNIGETPLIEAPKVHPDMSVFSFEKEADGQRGLTRIKLLVSEPPVKSSRKVRYNVQPNTSHMGVRF